MGTFIIWLGIYIFVMINYPKFTTILSGSVLALLLFLVFGASFIVTTSGSRGMGNVGGGAMGFVMLLLLGVLFIISLVYYLVTRHIQKHLLFDVRHDGNAFSFIKGRIKQIGDWDLLLDHSQGQLIADNPERANKVTFGGILNLDNTPFSTLREAPKSGYKAILPLNEAVVGNSYAVKLAAEQKFVILQITNYNRNMQRIEFKWKYVAS